MVYANPELPPLKIVLIEDSWRLREELSNVLGKLGGVNVVGEAEDEHSALDLLQTQQPDLAIVDLQLRAGSGLGVLQAISQSPERFGHLRAVVFSSHGHLLIRERCIALGAERYFDKATETEDLLAYVRQAIPS